MVFSSILGFPRIGMPFYCSSNVSLYITRSKGANREVKKAVEAYWAGKLSADGLTKVAADVRKASWISVKSRGVDYIPRFYFFCIASICYRELI
jgi:5-methyltetrahydropteroyltriglutamate--homocysteine methyltransferase